VDVSGHRVPRDPVRERPCHAVVHGDPGWHVNLASALLEPGHVPSRDTESSWAGAGHHLVDGRCRRVITHDCLLAPIVQAATVSHGLAARIDRPRPVRCPEEVAVLVERLESCPRSSAEHGAPQPRVVGVTSRIPDHRSLRRGRKHGLKRTPRLGEIRQCRSAPPDAAARCIANPPFARGTAHNTLDPASTGPMLGGPVATRPSATDEPGRTAVAASINKSRITPGVIDSTTTAASQRCASRLVRSKSGPARQWPGSRK
jgi:hypothetical protein